MHVRWKRSHNPACTVVDVQDTQHSDCAENRCVGEHRGLAGLGQISTASQTLLARKLAPRANLEVGIPTLSRVVLSGSGPGDWWTNLPRRSGRLGIWQRSRAGRIRYVLAWRSFGNFCHRASRFPDSHGRGRSWPAGRSSCGPLCRSSRRFSRWHDALRQNRCRTRSRAELHWGI